MRNLIVAVSWILILLTGDAYAGCQKMLDYSDDKIYCVEDSVEYGESIEEDRLEQQHLSKKQKGTEHRSEQGEVYANR